MPSEAYIGVSSSPKKIKEIYIGTTNGVKKVKEGYIGVGGVPKLFYRSINFEWLSIQNLDKPKYLSTSCNAGNYAIVYGGLTSTTILSSDKTAEAYNSDLVHSTGLSQSTYGAWDANAASVGNYAVFAGGKRGRWGDYANGDFASETLAYSSNLTKTKISSGVGRRAFMGSASFANRAIFAGGLLPGSSRSCSDTVYAYNSSLVVSTLATLDVERESIGAAISGNVLLFAGGDDWSSILNTVDIYTESLTKATSTTLQSEASFSASVSLNDYAMFIGPKVFGSSDRSNYVHLFKNGVQLTPIEIPIYVSNCVGISLSDYAIFAGSISPISYEASSNIIIFDKNLIQYSSIMLPESKGFMSSTVLGNYGLFFGGRNENVISSSVNVLNLI